MGVKEELEGKSGYMKQVLADRERYAISSILVSEALSY
jgi:hypothetical protein